MKKNEINSEELIAAIEEVVLDGGREGHDYIIDTTKKIIVLDNKGKEEKIKFKKPKKLVLINPSILYSKLRLEMRIRVERNICVTTQSYLLKQCKEFIGEYRVEGKRYFIFKSKNFSDLQNTGFTIARIGATTIEKLGADFRGFYVLGDGLEVENGKFIKAKKSGTLTYKGIKYYCKHWERKNLNEHFKFHNKDSYGRIIFRVTIPKNAFNNHF